MMSFERFARRVRSRLPRRYQRFATTRRLRHLFSDGFTPSEAALELLYL